MKIHGYDRLVGLLILAGSFVFAASLGLFAYAGAFSRYWADDYCYSAWVKTYGLPAAIIDWYQTSGNRLSTLAAVAISEGFGPGAIRFMPLVLLVVWVAAWVFCVGRVVRLLNLPVAPIAWLWLALVQVYFVVLLAPDRLQTLYWRMGALHYSLPLPLLLINVGLLAWAARQPGRRAVWASLGAGLLAFFAAGLSETFAALQAGLFALALAAAAWGLKSSRRGPLLEGISARRGLLLTAVPLAGTLLMMAIMAAAPANSWRQAAMPPPDNLLLIVPYSLRYAADFIFYTIRGRLVPYGFYVLGMAAFTLLVWRTDTTLLAPRRVLTALALTLLVTYGLIVCSFAPSAYAGLLYPAGRAQMPAAFILLAGVGLTAGLGAHLVRARLPALAWKPAALLLLVVFSLYPLRLAAIPRQEQAQLAVRAGRWDARDARIRSALASGKAQVVVEQTDVVQSLEDMGPAPTYWINACAAMYYGAGSITAIP